MLADSPSSRIRKTYPRLPEERKELASFNKIHHHVQVLGVLERAPQSDEEGMLDICQHSSLVVGVLDLLHLDYLGLLEHLDCVETLVVLRLDQMDSAEATSSKCPQDIEITQRVLALGDAHL
mgnify:CR=1 FL=1